MGIDYTTGNVYVADSGDTQISVYSPSGGYLTSFGTAQFGTHQPVGVGVNSSGTTVYTLEVSSTNAVYSYSISGIPSSPVYTYQSVFETTVSFVNPVNLYVDSQNNVYVADYPGYEVIEFNSSGVSIQTYSTSNSPAFTPEDLTVDNSGNVYVVNDSNSSIERFNSAGQFTGQFGILPYGPGFPAVPKGITTDGVGNFYVTYPSDIWRVLGYH